MVFERWCLKSYKTLKFKCKTVPTSAQQERVIHTYSNSACVLYRNRLRCLQPWKPLSRKLQNIKFVLEFTFSHSKFVAGGRPRKDEPVATLCQIATHGIP